MDISELPKEALFELLLRVEPREIGFVCRRPKDPKIQVICSSQLFEESYKKKYKLDLDKHHDKYNWPMFIEKPVLDFFKNADFGVYDETIHKSIDPFLKEGFLNRAIVDILFIMYLRSHNLYRIYKNLYEISVDNLMKKHLSKYLHYLCISEDPMECIQDTVASKDLLSTFVDPSLIPYSSLSFYEKLILKSPYTQGQLMEITNNLQEIRVNIGVHYKLPTKSIYN